MSYYPPVAFSFQVQIVGDRSGVDAGFSEVSGLEMERESVEVREGGENRFVHHLPGQVRPPHLVLKRGIMLASSALFDWCKTTLEADFAAPIEPRSLSLSLLDEKSKPLITWSVERAWPVKWSLARFDAKESAVAIETLEFTYHRLERKVMSVMAPTGLG